MIRIIKRGIRESQWDRVKCEKCECIFDYTQEEVYKGTIDCPCCNQKVILQNSKPIYEYFGPREGEEIGNDYIEKNIKYEFLKTEKAYRDED